MEVEKKINSVEAAGCFQASMTVEASFLLPLIFFLILNILYLSFFVYDQCILMQGCYVTALRMERLECGEEEKQRIADEKFDRSAAKRLACASAEKQIEMTDTQVKVSAAASMRAPGVSFFQSFWKGRQEQTVDFWYPKRFIRRCRSAKGLLGLWNEEI